MPRPSQTEIESFVGSDGFKYKYRLEDGTTRYRVKDGRKVNDLLSVTTIAGIGYDEWAEKNRRELLVYATELAREEPTLSEEELLNEITRYEWRKATRGTVLHEAVERYLKGENVEDFVEPDYQAMWTAWRNWFENRSNLKVLALEQPICNVFDGWAGQIDCVAKRLTTGELLIVDWKFGKPNPDYRWQLNAYMRATHKMTEDGELVPIRKKPTGCLVVSTIYDDKDGYGATREIPYRTDDVLYTEFLTKLSILRLGLKPWREQEAAAYLAGPQKYSTR